MPSPSLLQRLKERKLVQWVTPGRRVREGLQAGRETLSDSAEAGQPQ